MQIRTIDVSASIAISPTTGSHVGAERYDGDLSDIFAIQDEMTQAIVGAIEIGATLQLLG